MAIQKRSSGGTGGRWAHCCAESGIAAFAGRLHADGGPGVIGDLAYIGTGVLTVFKRTNGRKLSMSEREFNRSINSRRAPVERAIAHLRNWKMLTTAYHGLLSRFI